MHAGGAFNDTDPVCSIISSTSESSDDSTKRTFNFLFPNLDEAADAAVAAEAGTPYLLICRLGLGISI
jgi:hypothetical protein